MLESKGSRLEELAKAQRNSECMTKATEESRELKVTARVVHVHSLGKAEMKSNRKEIRSLQGICTSFITLASRGTSVHDPEAGRE